MPRTKTPSRHNEAIEFLIPLAARHAAAEEEGGGDWVPLMPVGRWAAHHFGPEGFYEITAENLAEIVANFEAGIPPIRIAGNENHSRGPAVGWVEGLRVAGQWLEARVSWTEPGKELLDKNLFGYISPEWYDEQWPYIISSSGEKVAWVLTGFGLTNNPFFVELPAVAERREDGVLVYAAGSSNSPSPGGNPQNTGDEPMPTKPNAGSAEPPEGGRQEPPPAGETVEALRAERDRLAAEKARLEAEKAERERASQLAAITTLFAAVHTGDRQLAEAHAKRLAEAAMEIPEDKRDAHVTATIEAMTQGFVPQGEIGGTSPNRSGEVNHNLFAAGAHLRIDPVHVHMAAVRGAGGLVDLESARAAISRMGPLAASIEIPSLDYQDTMTLVRAMFLAGWESSEPLINLFANQVTDSAREVSYNALGAPPRMRQWLDEIQAGVLNTLGTYLVEVQDWEATLEIPLTYFKADKLGQYAMRIQQMGAYARRHPDTLLLQLVAAAGSTLCYDGQYLCDTDHSEGSSGTQSNKLTTGYDDDEIADMVLALDANVAAMQKFKDDRGEPLDIGWQADTTYDILCRPEARATFNQLATANEISGTTNGWKGRLRVHSSARFTTADRFWFCYLGAPAKPLIVQYQTGGEPSALKELGPDSEHCKKTGRIWVSTQGHYKVIPGDWRYVIENNKS